jgi:hypothetical protein
VVGELMWAHGANETSVGGDAETVVPIAREVAAALGAQYDRNVTIPGPEYGRLLDPIWDSVSIH